MSQFKPGDIVVLKSGGPKMTVDSISDNNISCIWFADNKAESRTFKEITLREPITRIPGLGPKIETF